MNLSKTQTSLALAAALLTSGCATTSPEAAVALTEAAPTAEATSPPSALSEEAITYTAGDRTFEGTIVRPADFSVARPGVIIAHDFLGLGDYQREVARKLAASGYVVLAADFYGQGRRPAGNDEATQFAMEVRADPDGTRQTMLAAYEALKGAPGVDGERLAIIGYSVGAVAALELARAGADLEAVVGLWPILESTPGAEAEPVRAEVLMMVGALDPLTPKATVDAFETELRKAKTPHTIEVMPEVAHAFTVPAVGTDASTGFAYDADADARSWRAVEALLQRVMKQGSR